MSKNTRNTETKQFIRWAIAKLLEQHSFEEISVTMICREAAINRGTFYLHYLDKYDMMDKLKEETFSHIYAIISEDTKALTREVILAALQYIAEDFDFISVIASSTYVNLPKSIREFINYILDGISNFDDLISQELIVPEKFARTAYVASIESIISKWVIEGGQESPEEMADIIYQIATFYLMFKAFLIV